MKTTDFITEGIAEDADEMHRDHEVQMARADCYNAAKYAIELHKLLHKIAETQGLDGWVSEKITLANDYLRTVHEYLTHEMAQGQQDTVIIPEFSFESANAKFNRLVNEGVAEGVTSPEIKQAYKDIMNTAASTPDRKSAVKRYQKLRADALDKKRKEQSVAEGSQQVDSLVTDALKIMRGPESTDAIQALKTVLGDREFSSRRGFYNFYIRQLVDMYGQQGVAEGAEFGAYYYEQLAQQTFDINPNLQDENEILNLGYKIAKGELGSRAQGMFRDEDFPSDFVTAYGYLKKQGVAEMRNTGDPMDDMVEDYLDWLESVNMLDKSREEEKASILAGLESGVIHSSEIEYALSGTKWDPLAEVSDATLTSYLTKVDADSQKHDRDPTKRSAEKRNKSVAGFSRAFNKLDARKEKVDEIDPNNYDSDEDYYRDLEAQDQRNGATKRPYNPDWDADDEEFMQKWYEKHGLRESSVGGISAGAFATGPTAGGGKPGTGKPKKVGNMISRKKPQIGKGIY